MAGLFASREFALRELSVGTVTFATRPFRSLPSSVPSTVSLCFLLSSGQVTKGIFARGVEERERENGCEFRGNDGRFFALLFIALLSIFSYRGSKLVVRSSGEVERVDVGRKDSVETRFPDSRRKEKSLLPEKRTEEREKK